MEPNISSSRLILSAILLCLFVGRVSAQYFENTYGLTFPYNPAAQCWDGKPIPMSPLTLEHYIVLSNTERMSKSFISLFGIQEDGHCANGNHPSLIPTSVDELPTTDSYYGTAFELDYDGGIHVGYFITGYKTSEDGTNKRLIVIRTDLIGNPDKTCELPNVELTVRGLTILRNEGGVSIERQSNGDIIIVGSSHSATPGASKSKIVMARFDRNLVLKWSNRYESAGLSFEPKEACNGSNIFSLDPSNPAGTIFIRDVIAVTGVTDIETGGRHTFHLVVNAMTGTVAHTKIYHSRFKEDRGLDIVYRPHRVDPHQQLIPGYYMIVGDMIVEGVAGTHQEMWTLRLGTDGSAIAVTYRDEGFPDADFTATAVSLSVDGTNAAVAGRITIPTLPARTFAMEMPLATGVIPKWANYYFDTAPDPSSAESISPIMGSSSGYFVTSSDLWVGGAPTDYSQHAIRVDDMGRNWTQCTETKFSPTPTKVDLVSSSVTSTSNQIMGWNYKTMTSSGPNCHDQICTPLPLIGSDERQANGTKKPSNSLGFTLSPNPTAAGGTAQILFDLPEAQTVQLSVWDLRGRQVHATAHELPKGEQTLELSSASLPAGVYVARVNGKSGAQTVKWLIEGR